MIKIDFKPKSILGYLIAFSTLCLFVAGILFAFNNSAGYYFLVIGLPLFILFLFIYTSIFSAVSQRVGDVLSEASGR